MKEKSNTKTVKAFILSGLFYILVGLVILIFLHRIADFLNTDSNYIFIGGMVLILMGIKDIAIMPMFLDMDKENKKKD